MSNILNHNKEIFNIKLSNSEYWDHHLYLNQEGGDLIDNKLEEECLSVYIDTNIHECIEDNNLISQQNYIWEHGVNNGISLNNIGLTGVDNGLIEFKKDEITQEEFLDIYTNSKMIIPKDDIRLHLTKIQGNNKLYSYPNEFVIENGMNVAKLQGGFFQGFFQIENGCDYKVLPNVIENGWTLEFTLKPTKYISDYIVDKEKYSENEYNNDGWDGDTSIYDYFESNYINEYATNNQLPTLNDIYPDNIGIFFYIGTRAEHKWWKYYVEEEVNTNLTTNTGITLDEHIKTIETDNKFITYHRGDDGYKAYMNDINPNKILEMEHNLITDNYFIKVHNGKGGYTVRNIKELKQKSNAKYDILKDLYKNAFALQVKEDGRIGYKYLIQSCETESGYEIKEEWSNPQVVELNKWSIIDVRILPLNNTFSTNYDINQDKMRLMFYVNGKLVLYSQELPMIVLRMLNDIYSKQETVPFNISIGGGTQGLCDVIYEDYQKIPDYVLYLEKEFGGGFNGYLKSFKFYTCDKNYNQINSNVSYERKQLNYL